MLFNSVDWFLVGIVREKWTDYEKATDFILAVLDRLPIIRK